MKLMALSAMRRSVLRINDQTTNASIGLLLESMKRKDMGSSRDKMLLSEIIATKRPNAATLQAFLHYSLVANGDKRPYALYEKQKASLSLESLREYALYALRDRDPLYLVDILHYSKNGAVDPLTVKNNTIKMYKSIIMVKSVLICLFCNLQVLPALVLLGVNATTLVVLGPVQSRALLSLEALERQYFFTPLEEWTEDMVYEYFITLRSIESVKHESIRDMQSDAHINTLSSSKDIHRFHQAKDYQSLLTSFSHLTEKTPASLASAFGAMYQLKQPLEALQLYHANRKTVFAASYKRKRFILNSLIKALGFRGYPHYAELVLWLEFPRLGIQPTERSYVKVMQSIQLPKHQRAHYFDFWSTVVQSSDTMTRFDCDANTLSSIVSQRQAIQAIPCDDPLLSIQLGYFLKASEYSRCDPITFGIMMTGLQKAKAYAAAIRLFAYFHQTSLTHTKSFQDPYTDRHYTLEDLFAPHPHYIIDQHLFGLSSISNRHSRHPPSARMLRIAIDCLEKQGLDHPHIMTQLQLRLAQLQ